MQNEHMPDLMGIMSERTIAAQAATQTLRTKLAAANVETPVFSLVVDALTATTSAIAAQEAADKARLLSGDSQEMSRLRGIHDTLVTAATQLNARPEDPAVHHNVKSAISYSLQSLDRAACMCQDTKTFVSKVLRTMPDPKRGCL